MVRLVKLARETNATSLADLIAKAMHLADGDADRLREILAEHGLTVRFNDEGEIL